MMKIMTTAERTAKEDKVRKALVRDFVKRYGRKPHFPEGDSIDSRVREAVSNRSEEDKAVMAEKRKELAKRFGECLCSKCLAK
jgi:hypothetical protein